MNVSYKLFILKILKQHINIKLSVFPDQKRARWARAGRSRARGRGARGRGARGRGGNIYNINYY